VLCNDTFEDHYSLGNRKVCYNKDPKKGAIITGNYFTPPEPVEAVSTTPIRGDELGRGATYCPGALDCLGCDVCDAKVSTPLPQQELLHMKDMTPFEKWWDEQIRLAQIFLGSGDYWVSKGIAKKAWDAGRMER